MRLLDKFELLAGFGKFPTAVLGNTHSRDFELIPLERIPLEPSLEESYKARGLYFCGTFALIGEQGRCEFTELLPAETIEALATAYARLVLEKQKEQEHSIGASWLEKLWSLVDPREMN
jgi:hypothetical protein